jgi:hypothetical protein
MLKVFVLTVVMYLDSGYSGTLTSNQYYYPTNDACVFAGNQWAKKYPKGARLSTQTVNCEVAYLPK